MRTTGTASPGSRPPRGRFERKARCARGRAGEGAPEGTARAGCVYVCCRFGTRAGALALRPGFRAPRGADRISGLGFLVLRREARPKTPRVALLASGSNATLPAPDSPRAARPRVAAPHDTPSASDTDFDRDVSARPQAGADAGGGAQRRLWACHAHSSRSRRFYSGGCRRADGAALGAATHAASVRTPGLPSRRRSLEPGGRLAAVAPAPDHPARGPPPRHPAPAPSPRSLPLGLPRCVVLQPILAPPLHCRSRNRLPSSHARGHGRHPVSRARRQADPHPRRLAATAAHAQARVHGRAPGAILGAPRAAHCDQPHPPRRRSAT